MLSQDVLLNSSTGISLPSLFRSTLNLTPTVGIVNVDRSAPFAVRTQLSGGEYIRQGKRLEYGAGVSPTLFAFFPGFGPFSRIRHSFSPRVSYSFAPKGEVSDEFLAALNRTRPGYLGDLQQNLLSVGLTQVFEAKLRAPVDSLPDSGEKIKLLQLDFSSVAIAEAQTFATSGDTILLGAEGGPLLVEGSRAGRRFAYLGFALGEGSSTDVSSDSSLARIVFARSITLRGRPARRATWMP